MYCEWLVLLLAVLLKNCTYAELSGHQVSKKIGQKVSRDEFTTSKCFEYKMCHIYRILYRYSSGCIRCLTNRGHAVFFLSFQTKVLSNGINSTYILLILSDNILIIRVLND
jgi:hypothetical protein